MKRLIIAFLTGIIPMLGWAQKKDKNAVQAAATITVEDMKKHLYKIASKEMGGRNTPSPGLEKAATYIEDHFKSLGLAPGNNGSYRQYYPIYRDSMIGSSFTINGTSLKMNKDFMPQASNFSANMLFSEVVFAGFGIVDSSVRDDYKDLDVAGKLVMVMEGAPSDYKTTQSFFNSPARTSRKIISATKKGAAGLLIISTSVMSASPNLTSTWELKAYKESQTALAFSISTEVAVKIMGSEGQNLMDKMKAGTYINKSYPAEIELDYSRKAMNATVSNVLAVLEGSEKKDEYVFITGHYDHLGARNDTLIYYGADDNGSGTTGILELAEAFVAAKKAGHGPKRSIVFMMVSAEEKGLLGSEYYANHPVFPLEKTTVDLNVDMIGRTGREYMKDKDSANYVFIIGEDKISSELLPVTDHVISTYLNIKPDRRYNDPKDPNLYYYRSDHYNFAKKGVPIIFYFNGTHPDYHRTTDTPDKINYPMMVKRGQLIFHTAWEIANRPEMMKRDIKLEVPKGF